MILLIVNLKNFNLIHVNIGLTQHYDVHNAASAMYINKPATI